MFEAILQESIGTLPVSTTDYAAVPTAPAPNLGQIDNGQRPPPNTK